MMIASVGRTGAGRTLSDTYARQGQSAVDREEAVREAAAALGIPMEEFTPSVRDAIAMLLRRTENLRREMDSVRTRLSDATRNADLDALLPVLNRRAFSRELDRVIAIVRRYGTPSSLLYFDLDGFKRVNDTHGHAAGDALLAHFARLLSSHIRDTDVVARLGGDEFAVILTHITFDQALKKTESLERLLHETPLIWQGKALALRFSCGTCELGGADSAASAITEADRAMYTRKRGGR